MVPGISTSTRLIPYPLVGVISPWNFPLTLALIAFVTIGVFAVLLNNRSLHLIARILLSLGVGIQIGGFLARHFAGFLRLARSATLPAIGMAVLAAFAFRASDVIAERRAMARLGTRSPSLIRCGADGEASL